MWNGCLCQMDRSDYFQNCSDFLTPPLGFTENLPNKKKKSKEQQFSGRKCIVDAWGQRRMARPLWADRKATVIKKNPRLWMDFTSNLEAHGVQRKLRLQFCRVSPKLNNRKLEKKKVISLHCCRQHESVAPSINDASGWMWNGGYVLGTLWAT